MNKEFKKFENKPKKPEKEKEKEGKKEYEEYSKSIEAIKEADRINNGKELEKEKEIEDLLKKIKETPEYQEYQDREIKFSTLENIAEKTHKELENAKETEFKEKALKTIDDTVNDLKKRVQRYRRNIINMERLNNSPSGFRMDMKEKQERMKKLDRTRRNNHNVIQDKLRMISRFPGVVNEKLGTNLEWDNFFSSDEIENREFVKHWAFTMAAGEIMNKAVEKIEKKRAA